jgi:single-strand DNA-binding protein
MVRHDAEREDALDERLQPRNEVVLVGRVSAPAEERELPSGDVITTWRVVVDRPPRTRRADGGRAATVDTLDCVAWTAGLRRTARGLAAGDVVAVEGALRRRFWRAGAAAASRCEIEVRRVRRLAQASR